MFIVIKTYLCVSRFWEAVQELKALPQSKVQEKVSEIWTEYLAPDASCPINVDCQSYDVTKKNMENPDRWSFDCAAVSIYFVTLRSIICNIKMLLFDNFFCGAYFLQEQFFF